MPALPKPGEASPADACVLMAAQSLDNSNPDYLGNSNPKFKAVNVMRGGQSVQAFILRCQCMVARQGEWLNPLCSGLSLTPVNVHSQLP